MLDVHRQPDAHPALLLRASSAVLPTQLLEGRMTAYGSTDYNRSKSALANENHRRRRREQKAEIKRLRTLCFAQQAEIEGLKAALAAKPGHLTHCGRGHEFTEENTLHGRRGRECRRCRNDRQKAAAAKKRTAKKETST